MPDSDGLLYTRFLVNNDQDALEILFNKYKDSLILFIQGYIHNIDDAEELMMDTFARRCKFLSVKSKEPEILRFWAL